MGIDEFLDAGFQLRDAAIGAATDLLHGQFGEPPLHQTQPRTIGGRLLQMKARTLGESVPDERRFMRAVVIHDDVDVEPARNLRLNQIENSRNCAERWR